MMKRIVWGILTLLFFAGAFFLGYALTREYATMDNYVQLRMDMSKSEVHRLLGGPLRWPAFKRLPKGRARETWYGPEGTITVYFDENNRIFWTEWDNPRRTLWDDLSLKPVIRE
jgi:hypothetical protein